MSTPNGGGLFLWERADYDPNHAPDVQLRELLTVAKRAGCPFFPAWHAALDRVDWGGRRQRAEWLNALADPRVVEVWWAAFYDLPHPQGEAYAHLDVESVTTPDRIEATLPVVTVSGRAAPVGRARILGSA